MSVILGLVLLGLLIIGYKCRSLFSVIPYHTAYRSALHRVEQRGQPTLAKPCPRCNRDMEEGHVLIRYVPLDEDLSFLLQRYDPFRGRAATGTMESMITQFPFATHAFYRRGYRCPACGIVGMKNEPMF